MTNLGNKGKGAYKWNLILICMFQTSPAKADGISSREKA
jgi:hypothetical protein